METLPVVIVDIIMCYKKDMELLQDTPLQYRDLLRNYPPTYCRGDLTLSDIMLCFLVECLEIPPFIRPLLLDDFTCAVELWQNRLKLYGFAPHTLTPTWSDTLPYIVREYMSSSNIPLLEERLSYWVELIHNGCIHDPTQLVLL